MQTYLLTSGALLVTILFCGSFTAISTPTPIDRFSSIPADQIKQLPETDLHSPRSMTDEYPDPVPLPYPVNTAGAEDSAFIMPDGNTLYVWFTPDPDIPAESQLTDGVTGIYIITKSAGIWSKSERVNLQDPGKLALDGCEFVLGNTMWFCSAREGYTGINWFTAQFIQGKWRDWQPANFEPEYEVGELHITADGSELYFHSSRPGGRGGYDIWVSRWSEDKWQAPVNLEIVNSTYSDGWPFISQDGSQLWFTRSVGAPEWWRSVRVDGEWTQPQMMFAPFAGEASLDDEGNIYFTHHFYSENNMLEADIYYAPRNIP